jgi:very-short-patch-repair endonuclease
MNADPANMNPTDPLSLGERAGVRGRPPTIRATSVYGGRAPGLPRKLRNDQTVAEQTLWRYLRNRGIGGAKFRRQQPMGPYILDFYCHEHSLVVEVDGSQHYEGPQAAHDTVRTAWLEAAGLRVLRFDNRQVLIETDAVLETILIALEGPSPHPNPLPEGEGANDQP